MTEAVHHPAFEHVDVGVYHKTFADGRRELSCFYGANATGWAPMVAVWAIDRTDPKTDNEDVISINGMHFAYCTSDEQPEDFDGLTQIDDPIDARDWAVEMMIAGIIYERVKDM